jgi:hypothetical protein
MSSWISTPKQDFIISEFVVFMTFVFFSNVTNPNTNPYTNDSNFPLSFV